MFGLGLWSLMPLSTIFQVCRSVLLVEETGETTNLPQVTDKLYHMMLYNVSNTPCLSGVRKPQREW
jgi:hypothetical protein